MWIDFLIKIFLEKILKEFLFAGRTSKQRIKSQVWTVGKIRLRHYGGIKNIILNHVFQQQQLKWVNDKEW